MRKKFALKVRGPDPLAVCEMVDIERMDIARGAYISAEDIWEYNDIFSAMMARHRRDIGYLISPTLTRIEGQTFFYESVCRFVHAVSIVRDRKCGIIFTNLDGKLLRAIARRLEDSGRRVSYNKAAYFLYAAVECLKGILSLARAAAIRSLFILSSRFFAAPIKSRSYDYAIKTFYDYRSKDAQGSAAGGQYFAPLVEKLVRDKKSVLVLNRLIHYNRVGLFMRYAREASKSADGAESTLIERFMKLRDVPLSLFNGFAGRPRIDGDILFKGHDITYLTRLALAEDFRMARWLDTLLEYSAAKRIFGTLKMGELIYPYENHPWEKAYVFARNSAGSDVKIVGFQHSSISHKVVQHFPGRHETDLGIYPDRILTVGRILKEELESRGHYRPGLVEEGCALRHLHITGNDACVVRSAPRKGKVAYAFSFDMKNYPRVLGYLKQIFEGRRCTVYLKFHPVYIKLIKEGMDLPPNFIDARKMSWGDIFKEVDMLLYDDNSVGIEALKYGIDVVYMALAEQVYNTDRLFRYDREKLIIDSIRDFRCYLDGYYGSGGNVPPEDPEEATYNRRYLNDYFAPVTEERLARFLITA